MKAKEIGNGKKLMPKLKEYLNSTQVWPSNSWIVDGGFELYVRKYHRQIIREADGNVVEALSPGPTFFCVDFANINVTPMGQGIFTRFLKEFRSLDMCDLLSIENVLTERFAKFFEKQGFHYYWNAGADQKSTPPTMRLYMRRLAAQSHASVSV